MGLPRLSLLVLLSQIIQFLDSMRLPGSRVSVTVCQLCLHFLLPPQGGPFERVSPVICQAPVLDTEGVEARFLSYIQALRSTPTRPLLGVLPQWLGAMCVVPRWVSHILSQGYWLLFLSTPPPFLGVLETRLASEELMCALAREVGELLVKDAIEVVRPQLMLGGHMTVTAAGGRCNCSHGMWDS